MFLAGVFGDCDFREAKGVIEALLLKLHISAKFESSDTKGFSASKSALILSDGKEIGKIGVTDSGLVYYEFATKSLYGISDKDFKFKEISKYPSQIEDLTFQFPDKTRVGDVNEFIVSVDKNIESVSYVGNFGNSYTFNVKFHSDQKTLTDEDVEKVRNKIISSVKTKFGASLKD
jgi:phenylalanyl-tRNA synthetase beta chain